MSDVQVIATDPAGGHDAGWRGDWGFGNPTHVLVIGVLGLKLGGAHPVGRYTGRGPESDRFLKQAEAKDGVVETGQWGGGAFADLLAVDGMENYRIPLEKIKATLNPTDGTSVSMRNLFMCHSFVNVGNPDYFRLLKCAQIVALQVLCGADGPCGFIIALVDLGGHMGKLDDSCRLAAIAAGDRFVSIGHGAKDKRDDYAVLLDGCREILNALGVPFQALLIGGSMMDLLERDLADRD